MTENVNVQESGRFRVNLGLSIVKDEVPGYADFGLTYQNLPYDMMVQVEAIFNRHADAALEALRPVRDELIALGMEVSQQRK